MKTKISIFIFLILLTSVSLAMGSAPPSAIKTGDADLDASLKQVQDRAGQPGGRQEIEGVLRSNYGVTQKQIDGLHKKGYRMNEIYYMSLLARHRNRNVNEIAAMHAKGEGWGVLAKRLNVHPGDLNRLRLRLHKMDKAVIKQQQKEQVKLKPAPKPILKPAPFKPAGRRR